MRIRYLCLAVILALFVANEGYATAEWEVFGPTMIERRKGASTSKTFTFSALGGKAAIQLTNRKVTSATAIFNGETIFYPSDFKKNIDYLEREILLSGGQNTLEVVLRSKSGTELTIRIVQEVAEITHEIVRVRTANCLRAGDIKGALEGFAPNERAELIPSFNVAQKNDLAESIENAEFLTETGALRWYQYKWTNESGENFIKFSMTQDEQGIWIITSW